MAFFVGGVALGAGLVGGGLGWIGGQLPQQARAILPWAFVAVLTAHLWNGLRFRTVPVPSSSWRVPRSWAALGPNGYAFLFGGALGLGFLTVVGSWAQWALIVAAMQSATAWHGGMILLAFGLGRILPYCFVARCQRGGMVRRQPLDCVRSLRDRAWPVAIAVQMHTAAALGLVIFRPLLDW